MRTEFKGCTIVREFTRHTYEHEILLSFLDDEGAEAFSEWWNVQGNRVFANWIEASRFTSQLEHVNEIK